MITDTTFFTNEPGYALLDRFKKALKHVQCFDVLVGYSRTSGFHQLCESLESHSRTKKIFSEQTASHSKRRQRKTDSACFIKKSASKKTTSNFMHVLHECSVGTFASYSKMITKDKYEHGFDFYYKRRKAKS